MTRSVAEEPVFTLARWHFVYDPAVDGYRLVGVGLSTGRGRISSRVVGYDHDDRRAVTESGRLYLLSGEPDAKVGAAILRSYIRMWGLTLHNVTLADAEEIAALQDSGEFGFVPLWGRH